MPLSPSNEIRPSDVDSQRSRKVSSGSLSSQDEKSKVRPAELPRGKKPSSLFDISEESFVNVGNKVEKTKSDVVVAKAKKVEKSKKKGE